MNLTKIELQALVDEPYFSRGEAYFKDGLVDLISIKQNHVRALATGTSIYKVSFKRKGNLIEGYCTCPAFEDFGPCKHIAATGFALIKCHESGYEPSDEYFERAEFFNAIERALSKQTKEDLIAFILRLTNDYPEIMEMIEQDL